MTNIPLYEHNLSLHFPVPPFFPSFFLNLLHFFIIFPKWHWHVQCTPLPRYFAIYTNPLSVKFVAQTFQDLNNHIFLELVQRIKLFCWIWIRPMIINYLKYLNQCCGSGSRQKSQCGTGSMNLVNCSEQNASVREFSNIFS
jgi:hypothetical protein